MNGVLQNGSGTTRKTGGFGIWFMSPPGLTRVGAQASPGIRWTLNFVHNASWLWAAGVVGLPVAALIVFPR